MQRFTRRLMQEKTENQSWDQPRAGEPVGVRRRGTTRSSLLFAIYSIVSPPEILLPSRLHPASHEMPPCSLGFIHHTGPSYDDKIQTGGGGWSPSCCGERRRTVLCLYGVCISSGDVLIFPPLVPAASSELQFQLYCVANLCRLCSANNASCKWAARGRSTGWGER